MAPLKQYVPDNSYTTDLPWQGGAAPGEIYRPAQAPLIWLEADWDGQAITASEALKLPGYWWVYETLFLTSLQLPRRIIGSGYW